MLARAQAEVDSVVGDDRAPTLVDHLSLSYVKCILKELLRFNPVVTLAVHSNEKDDEYSGYHIPKGMSCFSPKFAYLCFIQALGFLQIPGI